jgi:hypothetical protein
MIITSTTRGRKVAFPENLKIVTAVGKCTMDGIVTGRLGMSMS